MFPHTNPANAGNGAELTTSLAGDRVTPPAERDLQHEPPRLRACLDFR